MKDGVIYSAYIKETSTGEWVKTTHTPENKKVRGSHQFEESTKKAISTQAKLENRTFNNMLEELAKRALAAQ